MGYWQKSCLFANSVAKPHLAPNPSRQGSGLRFHPRYTGREICGEATATQDSLPLCDHHGPGQRRHIGIQVEDAEVAACRLILIVQNDCAAGLKFANPLRAVRTGLGGAGSARGRALLIICNEGFTANDSVTKRHADIAGARVSR